MSKEAVRQFFRSAETDPNLQLEFRSITDQRELFKLGRRHGFHFSRTDLAEASSASAAAPRETNGGGLAVARIPESLPTSDATARLLHYEWSFDQLRGFEDAARDLRALRIQPETIDLAEFDRHFRPDDREFADASPAAPGFRARYDEMMRSESDTSTAFSRRPFHLVNLDEHIDHALYDAYFVAKTRLVASLERFFGGEVRFSGSMWYPPKSYRAWHTNETQPGWRMYLIDFDGSEEEIAGKSFFRYMNPQSGELVTLFERPGLIRFFKIEQERDKRLWHCIVNDSAFSRWSFGFMVAESWMKTLL